MASVSLAAEHRAARPAVKSRSPHGSHASEPLAQVKPDAGEVRVDQREQDALRSPDAGAAIDAAAGSGGTHTERAAGPKAGSAAAVAGATANSSDREPAAAGSGGAPSSLPAAGAASVARPVTGTLIDYRMRKLAGVSVRIGEQQTTTDAEGKFSIPDAPGRYDVTLLIQTSIRNSATSLVWQFQGLTRRDPTLQIYRGLPDRFGEVMIHLDNVSFPLAAEQTILVGWSSEDGDFALDVSSMDVQFLSPSWSGPALSTGNAHALLVNMGNGIPTDYLAHDTQSLLMTADKQSDVAFDLGGGKPSSELVRGTVSGAALGDRRNEMYLRFRDDETAVLLVDQWGAADSFEYPAPVLPDASVTVVAKSVVTGGIAAAYAEAAPGGSALTLALPTLPTLAAPDDGKSGVDGSTQLHWNGDAKVFVLAVRAVDSYDGIYVVTEAKQTRLPIGAELGYTPRANASFEWAVEVHDAYKSIDEAASDAGHLSAYATDSIRGPRRGAGRYAQSVPRVFTTPP